MAEETEDAFDKLKAGAKAVTKKVTDPSKDLEENIINREVKTLKMMNKNRLTR